MKLTKLHLWHLPLTSHEAYYMADGKTCDTVETVVIAVETDTGLTGWGEVCPIPHYLPAYARRVAPALSELAPVIIGGDPLGVEALMARANAWLPGHAYAKSALDIALWDITGKAAGLPLFALLGGRQAADLPLYHSITCVAPDEMALIAHEAHNLGIMDAVVLNLCDLSGYVTPRLAPDGPVRVNGRIAPPDGPGLGITPDRDLLGSPDLILD